MNRYNSNKFVFMDNIDKVDILENSYVVDIQQKISNEEELFEIYANALHFPDYFGKNWNAFWDVMADLHWVPQKNLIIKHHKPLLMSDENLRVYIEILCDTVNHWEKIKDRNIVICFQNSLKNKIDQILASSSDN